MKTDEDPRIRNERERLRKESTYVREARGRIAQKCPVDAIAILEAAIAESGSSWLLCRVLGDALQANGQLEEAQRRYDEALTRGDQSDIGLLKAVDIRFQLPPFSVDDSGGQRAPSPAVMGSRLDQIEQLLARTVGRGTAIANASFRVAAHRYDRGEYEAARDAFLDGFANAPGSALAHYFLGEAERNLGDFAAAIESYEGALDLASDEPEALDLPTELSVESGLMVSLVAMGRHEEGVVCARRAVRRIDESTVPLDDAEGWTREFRLRAAVSSLELKRYNDVERFAHPLLTNDDPFTATYAQLLSASVDLTHWDYGSAFARFDAIHNLYRDLWCDPTDSRLARVPESYGIEFAELLVEVFVSLNEFDDAERVLDQAMDWQTARQRPRTWMLRTQLALVRLEYCGGASADRGRWRQWEDLEAAPKRRWQAEESAREAERLLLRSLEQDAKPEDKYAIASLWSMMGDWERAMPYFEEALTARPDLEGLRAGVAIACAGRGEFKEAVRHYRSALARNPEQLDDRVHLGNALRALGSLAVAEDELRSVLELSPTHVSALVALGGVLVDLGDAGQADAYLEATHVLADAIALSDANSLNEASHWRANECLGARRLSRALYAYGYALVKRNEVEAQSTLFGSSNSLLLKQAEDAFNRAAICDPTNFRSRRAAQQAKAQRHVQRASGRFDRYLSGGLAAVALVLLLAVQIAFYWNLTEQTLDATAYAALTTGLLVLVIAACCLPQLLKLKVAGVELEKTSSQLDLPPAKLELARIGGPETPQFAARGIAFPASDAPVGQDSQQKDPPRKVKRSLQDLATKAADPQTATRDAQEAAYEASTSAHKEPEPAL